MTTDHRPHCPCCRPTRGRPRGADLRRRRPDQRGLSESVQWAVLTPVLLMLVLGVVHAGLLLAGRHAASNAALTGAETAAVAGGGPGSQLVARHSAQEVAERAGLRQVQVEVVPGSDVTVVVRGRIDTFWPGPSRVEATAVMPAEVPR